MKKEQDQTSSSSVSCLDDLKTLKKHAIHKKILYASGIIIAIIVIVEARFLIKRFMEERKTDSDVNREDLGRNIPIETDIGVLDGKVLLIAKQLRLISRTEWLAQPENDFMAEMKTPVENVVIIHTATENCSDQSSCTFIVRTMQTFHIESRNWSDIGYNFMIGGDGAAYEGRGWDKVGAHSKGYNNISYGIAVIGTYNTVLPTERQLLALKQLIELGVVKGKINKNYKLLGHRQLIPTLSPGDKLFNEIKSWPHFSNTID